MQTSQKRQINDATKLENPFYKNWFSFQWLTNCFVAFLKRIIKSNQNYLINLVFYPGIIEQRIKRKQLNAR